MDAQVDAEDPSEADRSTTGRLSGGHDTPDGDDAWFPTWGEPDIVGMAAGVGADQPSESTSLRRSRLRTFPAGFLGSGSSRK
jgi:hypothetical protein